MFTNSTYRQKSGSDCVSPVIANLKLRYQETVKYYDHLSIFRNALLQYRELGNTLRRPF